MLNLLGIFLDLTSVLHIFLSKYLFMQYYIALCTIKLNTPFFTFQRLYTYKLMYSSLHRVTVILIQRFSLGGGTQRNKIFSDNERFILVLSVASLVIVSMLLMIIT